MGIGLKPIQSQLLSKTIDCFNSRKPHIITVNVSIKEIRAVLKTKNIF